MDVRRPFHEDQCLFRQPVGDAQEEREKLLPALRHQLVEPFEQVGPRGGEVLDEVHEQTNLTGVLPLNLAKQCKKDGPDLLRDKREVVFSSPAKGEVDEGLADDVGLDGRDPAGGCAQALSQIVHQCVAAARTVNVRLFDNHVGGAHGLVLAQPAGEGGAGGQVYAESPTIDLLHAAAQAGLLPLGQGDGQVDAGHAKRVHHWIG